MLIHKSNIEGKLKKEKGKNQEYIKEIKKKYSEWISKIDALKDRIDDEAIKKKVQDLSEYKDFIDQPKFKKNQVDNNGWTAQSKLHSTVLEEFMYHLLNVIPVLKNGQFNLGPIKAYSNLFFAPRNINSFTEMSGLMVNEKDQDFAISKEILIKIGDEEKKINIPIISIENKTFLDKTMLDGSIATAAKIKSGNPYCFFSIVCETYEVSEEIDPQYTDIDQIYSLRKSTKRGSSNPIQADIILDLFSTVKNHLDSTWSDVAGKIKSGKII
jgi:hypothetical protein